MKNFICAFVYLLLATPCSAQIITVDDDGSADFNDIQQAIVSAVDGDIIKVQPGVYLGNINFYGKAVTVTSTDQNDPNIVASTVIDRREEFHSVRFDCGEDSNTALIGFTVRATNLAKYKGCGITCYYSSPLIKNNVVVQHETGILGESAYPTLLNNYIHDNSGSGIADCGGVVRDCIIENNGAYGLAYCDATITNCVISHNLETGLLFCDGSIKNCIISKNGEGLMGGSAQVKNCTIVYNTIGNGLHNCQGEIKNCIIAFNGKYGLNSCTGTTKYNDVWDNAWGNYAGGTLQGFGDIHADPLFESQDNYHLRSQAGRWDAGLKQWIIDDVTSPCIDAGDPNSDWAAELWPHGKRINMGAYGGTPQASMSLANLGNIADLNTDGFVHHADMTLLMGKWLCNSTLLPEDLDRNGIINFSDFAIIAENWLWKE